MPLFLGIWLVLFVEYDKMGVYDVEELGEIMEVS